MRSELNKMVPVIFILSIIAYLLFIYSWFHLKPLLQLDKPKEDVDVDNQNKGYFR